MRCKMVCQSVGREFQAYNKQTVTAASFRAVSDGSEENKAFFAATPSGELKLGVVNDAAVAGLVPGKSYYIDISEAPTP